MLFSEQILTGILHRLLRSVETSFSHDNGAHTIISLVREMDLLHENLWMLPAAGAADSQAVAAASRQIKFGYPAGLRLAYPAIAEVQSATHFFAAALPGDGEWAQEVIYQTGKAVIGLQLLDNVQAGVAILSQPSHFEFVFRNIHAACGIEYFDELDQLVVRRELASRIQDELVRRNLLISDDAEITMHQSMDSPRNLFISYHAPAEVWSLFLEQAAYWQLLQTAGEDFGPDDMFGGIRYEIYHDAVRYMIAVGMMHAHYCTLLIGRQPELDEGVLLTYVQNKQRAVEELGEFLETEAAVTEAVLGCLCLGPDSYEIYLDEPGVPPPPYLTLSDSQLVRSVAGCLDNPSGFLNRMLKIKHPLEHSKAVNEREIRFIRDLGQLFAGDRFIRIEKPVLIRSDKGNTDIDAVIYDTQTKALGLFQLKWQDPLGESVKLRRTKAENLYKANEWVDKVCSWLQSRSGPEILKSTRVIRRRPAPDALGEVFLFVLGRNNIHFTNSTADPRAVWGSWQGVRASRLQVAAFMEDDPIRELYTKLWLYQAQNRSEFTGPAPTEYAIQLGPYRIVHLDADPRPDV